jgi:copper chaperone CopZ
VAEVDVDLTGGTARIAYDPAQTDQADLRRVLTDGGYPVA